MLWAVLMAGGSGTRFWPESRKSKPKQFLEIFGKKTLLEQTVSRVSKLVPKSRVLVVTNQEHRGLVARLLKLKSSQVVGEPVGRNTAPCVALAAALILKKDPHAVIALLPSDHRIGKPEKFRRALKVASEIAAKRKLPITFGIQPTFPHTGYGYLERGRLVEKKHGFLIFQLKRFREKPTLSKAKGYLKSKRFFWNSGIFVWRADEILRATKRFQPKIFRVTQKITQNRNLSKSMKRHFSEMTSISMDYGLMEPLKKNILTLPIEMDWHDLGGWQSFEGLWPKDRQGNVSYGRYLPVESSRNIIKSGGRLIATLGLKDFVIIDTPDALLVCPKEKSEEVRKVVNALKKSNAKQYL